MLANKLIEKISDPCNAKEHYQSSIMRKNRKSVKQSKIVTYQPKTFERPKIVDIKWVIRQNKKRGSNSRLYSKIKKLKIFSTTKM